ncbi:hypothetical protein ACE6ED_14365 [Paenibacillus sp. CN-4]|uniref:hypothetical protein n=1 Tax=Paenibacillus nanchangensis TaxID=3348343 RepID=UPI003979C83E
MKKNTIAASVLALAITVGGGSLITGQAFAATSTGTASTAQSAAAKADGTAKGRGGDRGLHAKIDQAALASLFKMTEPELRTAQKAGKTLATIAGEQGVTVQSVIDVIAKQLTANLDTKLADGKLTQAQYDTAKAEVTTRATELANRALTGKSGMGGHGGAKIDEAAIAALLGMTETEFDAAEDAGKSIASMATEKGVDQQKVIDLVTKQLTTALDERLTDGKITQTEYDAQKAKLASKAQEIVNNTHTGKGKGGHRDRDDEAAGTAASAD